MVPEMFAKHKEDLPEEWHETFDTLVGQGNSPSGIKAAIEYVTTDRSQPDVAEEFGTSDTTIRNLQEAVVALGPADRIRRGGSWSSTTTARDCCTFLADHLGWEEGVEYSLREPYNGSNPQPNLLKSGWQSLVAEVVEERDTDD